MDKALLSVSAGRYLQTGKELSAVRSKTCSAQSNFAQLTEFVLYNKSIFQTCTARPLQSQKAKG